MRPTSVILGCVLALAACEQPDVVVTVTRKDVLSNVRLQACYEYDVSATCTGERTAFGEGSSDRSAEVALFVEDRPDPFQIFLSAQYVGKSGGGWLRLDLDATSARPVRFTLPFDDNGMKFPDDCPSQVCHPHPPTTQ